MELTIECKTRTADQKPKALRRQGLMPAVLYGHNGADSVALTLDAHEAQLLVGRASENNTLITVKVPDMPWSGKALLREVQAHPWKKAVYHLSFFSVASQSELEVTVPLNFVGEAYGVDQEGGVLDTVMTEMSVKCAPSDIPEVLDIDVSELKLGDALHVGELKLPAGVVAVAEPEKVVVSVLQPRMPSGSESEEGTSETAAVLDAVGYGGDSAE
jgi:large subunit ribosomal protein L25